ncbi:MAG: aminomethyltransferase family protein [Candidatus Eisenbacteria bacterium]|nr:aminomethyltransferase family protein [Candidatus Eisenbacteria bacterium]
MGTDSRLFAFLETIGAHTDERRGRPLAAHFGDPAWEYDAVRRSVGLIDRSSLGAVRIRGADRAAFLEHMLANDVKDLAPGAGRWNALLAPNGKFIALFRLLAFAESFLALLDREDAVTLSRGLDPYLILEEAEIEDTSAEWGAVHVAGPESGRLLASLSGSPLPHLPPGHHRPLSLPGIPGPVHAVRECPTGEDGFDLLVQRERLVDAWRLLLLHEAPKPRPVGDEAFEILRMEAGTPLFGADIGPDLGPLEAGLESVVSFGKGCFPGQEILAKTHHRGKPPKSLVGLAIEGDRPPDRGSAVLADGAEVGRITSAVRSIHPGGVIAFAVIRTTIVENRPPLFARAGDRVLAARLAELPFR